MSNKKILGVMALLLLIGPFSIFMVGAQTQDSTLLFAESFNQDLSRWTAYTGPNSTITLQSIVYNSSPMALLVNLSDWQAALIHELPGLKADYIIELLFYPEGVGFNNYGLYSDFEGPIDRVRLSLNGLTVFINEVATNATLISDFWNSLKLEISYNGSAKLTVNNNKIGSYPTNQVNITGIMLGTWPSRSANQDYSGCGYFDDLKIYITPIPPQELPQLEEVNVVNLLLIVSGVGVLVVAVIAFLFGRLYYMGRRIQS